MAAKQPSVLLASLPWTTLLEPATGLGLLAAVLEREGIPCRTVHLNLFLLEYLRPETYNELAKVNALNDFLFSGVLDPEPTNVQLRRLRQRAGEFLNRPGIDIRRWGGVDGAVEQLLRLRNEVFPAWLERWADEIAAHPATLVGFTCMFDQTVASLALASLVRARAPEKLIAFGGYAVQSPTAEMLVRASPWIDAVCIGEGEVAVVELAKASVGEVPLAAVPGIAYRDGSRVATNPPAPPVDLDANPDPTYDDFFADIRRLAAEHEVEIRPPDLPIENSRGCWWGAKHHCVFCGIRDADLAYRRRAPEAVLATMDALHERYGVDYFHFTDYILPHQYFTTLLPELARRGRPYRVSGEMKANISFEKFALLHGGGFEEVQPGIESFSSSVLRKMDKGVSAAQNVYTLMLGRRFGVKILYNILFGFPDDEQGEYERMVEALPRLVHLDPPVTCVPVQITRWAPLQVAPERFGIEEAPPEEAYDLIFSRSYLERTGFEIADFCYYFERPFAGSVALARLYGEIELVVDGWRKLYAKRAARLVEEPADDGMLVRDSRDGDEVVHRLDAEEAEVLRLSTRPTTAAALARAARAADVEGIVERLDERGLVFREDDAVVSLVVPAVPTEPAPGELDERRLALEPAGRARVAV